MPKRNPGRSVIVVLGLAALATAFGAGQARAQATNPFLGEIIMVGFNFCPTGWAAASGQLLAINQNQALFSLLGTTYGGTGNTDFALPNLNGRVPIGPGTSTSGTSFTLGQTGGEETHTLTVNELPAHAHGFSLGASTTIATDAQPSAARVLSTSALGDRQFTSLAPNTTLAAGTSAAAGGGQPHNNMQPYLAITYCIAMVGVFPTHP
jgi:microcystin-dependent protein